MKIAKYQLIQATPLQSIGYRPPDIRNLVGQVYIGSILSVPSKMSLSPYIVFQPGFPDSRPTKDPLAQPAAISPPAGEKPTPITLSHVATNLGIGTGIAGSSLQAINIANTTNPQHLAELLQNYNVSPDAAKFMADKSINYAQSNMGKIVCVFVASSGLALGVVEAFKPDWPWKKKLNAAAIFGLIIVAIVIILEASGIFTKSKVDQNKTPQPSHQTTH